MNKIKMVVVDYDLEGLDDDEIRKVMGEEMYVYKCIEGAVVDTDVVRQVFKDIGRYPQKKDFKLKACRDFKVREFRTPP